MGLPPGLAPVDAVIYGDLSRLRPVMATVARSCKCYSLWRDSAESHCEVDKSLRSRRVRLDADAHLEDGAAHSGGRASRPVLLRHPEYRRGGARQSRPAACACAYLNIGDPVAFGFQPPAHLIEAATRAMRDGHNGYLPSAGIPEAREAVAADYAARGIPVSRGPRAHHDRHIRSDRHRAECARGRRATRCSSRRRPIRSTRRCSPRSNAQPRYYRTDLDRDWLPDLDHLRSLITPRTRVLVVIDPNNPTGAVYPPPRSAAR